MAIPVLSGLKDIAGCYDAFIIDLWGVVHDGRKPYEAAIDVLGELKQLNKPALLLSNSPRRVSASIAHLENMGLPRALYAHIYTSGECTHEGLKNRPEKWQQSLGRHLYHLGPALHQGIYAGLPYLKTDDIENADFILATGMDYPQLDDYDPLFKIALARQLPMICANPDRIVAYEGETRLCCGAVAHRYEQLGGAVHYYGKPYAAIYQSALGLLLGLLPDINRKRMLVIGDSLTTDIKGAQTSGIDSVLVMGGIHRQDLAAGEKISSHTPLLLQNLTRETRVCPTYAIDCLRW